MAIPMGFSGPQNRGTAPYKAVFWGHIPLHRPYIWYYMVGTSNKSVPEMAMMIS